ncbi:MAG: S9 family peptidase [Sphaerobacter sp.]|nr:S9 family peptidase [Sphaerobacter sp.]
MAQERLLGFERAVTATLVTDVQLSPDGRQVAYVTTPASKEGPYPVSTIWLVAADGGHPRRLTGSEAADAAPRWSPDGRRLVFVSDRLTRGTAQVYLLDLAGGEAVRLTNAPGGVVQAAWSPDGSRIAYTALDAETPEAKQRREEGNDARVIDADVKRASLWVVEVPADTAALDPSRLPAPRRLSPEGVHIGTQGDPGFAWAPDGTALLVLASPAPKAHFTFAPELAVIRLDGEMTSLGRFEGLLTAPQLSPDGATIAFVAAEEVIPALFSLQTIPAAGGTPRILAPGFAGSFYAFAWLPDGQRLLAGVEIGQRHTFKLIDVASGAMTDAFAPFERPGTGAMRLSLSADGSRAAFVYADDYSYVDVYVADLGDTPRRLTDLNPWTRDYTFGEVRDIRWTAPDGLEIEGLLILPVGYEPGRRYPLLVHIHGGPCGAWTHHLYAGWHDWGQFFAQRGYAVFLPNPRGSSGRGTAFLCGIVGCYGEPDWEDINSGVDYLIAEGIADPDQLVVGGWSGGGFLTNWAITHTDRFKAAVSGAGIANWVSFQGTADVRSVFDRYLGPVDEAVETHWRLSPIRVINRATTPTLILYGEADIRVPPSQGFELYEGLKSRGVETQLVIYPREPHVFTERKHQIDLLERVVAWYERHLGRDGTSQTD